MTWKRAVCVILGVVAVLGLWIAYAPVTVLNLLVPRFGYHVVSDLSYGTNPRQKLDLYVPDDVKGKAPVMVFFYGGSWKGGSKMIYRAFGQAFASAGIIVAIVDYRVYPEIRYPVFNEDGARAFKYMHDNAATYGGDPERMFLTGHSAGAYIAVMLATNPSLLRDAGADPAWIRGVIGIAGPYDFIPLTDPDLITIFGGNNRPETMPITYVDGKRPPMFLAMDTEDRTVWPRNTQRLSAKLRSFDSPVEVKTYPGAGHVGIILSLAAGFRGMTTLRQDILDFVAQTSAAP